jgi:A/G-specific adenine glycosylase
VSNDLGNLLGGLAGWFNRSQRILPWRERPEVYRVWISEIMLQQTQVVTVVPYFEKFIARFPTVETLAQAPEEDVLLHWAGLGYYSRARNIHKAAKMIVAAGAASGSAMGRFPSDREGWLEIPGVGQYTAGAILSIALNLPEPILDGNVERVISRFRRVSRRGGDTFYKERLWRLSKIIVRDAFDQKIDPRVTNQALMELGATICTYKKPKCLLCPVASGCRAHAQGVEENFPPKKKAKTWLDVREELHCVVGDDGRVLLRKREKGEWRAGLWDLMGDVAGNRNGNAAGNSTGDLASLELIGEIESKHIVTRHKITRLTKVWRAKHAWSAQESTSIGGSHSELRSEYKWINPFEPEVAIGSALKKTLNQIRETFPEAWPTSSVPASASSRWD